MEVIKYYWPFQEVVGNGPQISIWTNSKTPELLLAPIFLTFVFFPLMNSMHIFKSEKLRESRIPSNTSLWILCLEIYPKHLGHMEEFSLVNLCFVPQLLACKNSLICETLISIYIDYQPKNLYQSYLNIENSFFHFQMNKSSQICPNKKQIPNSIKNDDT